MPREVAIVGCGMAQFGNRTDKSLMDLLKEASTKAMEHSGLGETNVSAPLCLHDAGRRIN